VLFVSKIKGIFIKKNSTQNTKRSSFLNIVLAKRRARRFALFIALTFENYERNFFYEILILIKSKKYKCLLFF